MAERIYKVKLIPEHTYKVEKEADTTDVKILMLKGERGEKGDTGERGERGEQGPKGEPGSGVSCYADLPDKPSINDIMLVGDKSLEDLNVIAVTNTEIENMLTDD